MLRDWSDEWKNARLALELRGDELFQGETLAILIHATVALDTTPSGGSLDAVGTPPSEASISVEEARTMALEKLELRWRRHCDGALVDLKVVEPAASQQKLMPTVPSPHATSVSAPPQQVRTTLFHQESRLVLLPLQPAGVTPSTKPSVLRVMLTMRCECTLRVRAEFWQRPLTFVARVMPSASQEDSVVDVDTVVQPLTSVLLNDTFVRTQIIGRLREQTTEPPNLMRRVEHKVHVVKPLVLKMETKFTSHHRVVIVARASNTHDTLGVRVLDLQLHINQFAGNKPSGSSRHSCDYRVARAPTDDFPVALQPHEQYNFVFIVEPTSSGFSGTTSPQSLLTLSWETMPDSTLPSDIAPLLQPITEHHTILWSPHPHRVAANALSTTEIELLELLPLPPPLVPTVVSPKSSVSPPVAIRRGDRSCPLNVKLAPLHASPSDPVSHRVGVVETLCIVVANRSQDGTEFDVSLVVPPSQSPQRSWLAFEGSHHLGRLRPGTIIRKSVRLVFLRHGRVDLNAFLLFDHISRTWFLPPTPSAGTAWELFVHP